MLQQLQINRTTTDPDACDHAAGTPDPNGLTFRCPDCGLVNELEP